MTFTKGGVNAFKCSLIPDPVFFDHLFYLQREGFYGWMGYGGSVFQWNPDLKISFAYVPTELKAIDFVNGGGAKLQKLVMDCVKE